MMKSLLREHPSKILNRVLLAAGIAVFIPVYAYNYSFLAQMPFGMKDYAEVITAFSADRLSGLVRLVIQNGRTDVFIRVYVLNMISTAGFTAAFFALFLMIARKYPADSRLSGFAYWGPPLAVKIGVLDTLFSILFLVIINNPPAVSDGVAFVICASYVVRMVIIYLLAIWALFSAVYFVVAGLRKKKTPSA